MHKRSQTRHAANRPGFAEPDKRRHGTGRDDQVCQRNQKKQQMAAGAALAAKRGEIKKSSLKGASKQMAKSMIKKQLKEFARTKRKNLPTKKRSK